MRLRNIIAFTASIILILGIYLNNLTLTSLSALICIAWLAYGRKREVKISDIISEISTGDPLNFLSRKIFEIKGLQAVEVNLAEDVESQTFKSFVFGTPSSSAFQEVFKISIGDLDLGNFKVYSTKKISAATRKNIEELSYQVAACLLLSHFRYEIIRFKKLSEQSKKATTGFLANLSHELRGPLGNILNASEMILDTPLEREEILDLSRIAVSNARHLMTIINDILEFAKCEAMPSANMEPIELRKHLNETIELVKSMAAKRKIRIKVNLEAVKNDYIMCDKKHFKQILINLLTNAIKYNKEGGEIEVFAEKEARRVRINVKDTGIGIPQEFLPKIFEPFERAKNDLVDQQTGTGLGLALVKRLVEINDGFIEVDSEEGSGSVFSVAFQLTRPPEVRYDLADKREPNGRGAFLLVSESLRGSSLPFIKYLAQKNFKLGFVKTLEELLTIVNHEQVDCILVDHNFSLARQREFFDVLRAVPGGKQIPVVLVSPRSFDFELEADLKKGFDLCLVQPFDLRDAGLKISDLVESARALGR
ncbi:MAG: hybrid sensor histidine kinase/response regulator [Deltaproteobacteria bacterium]|nr:hybrid sensor histidine kinase/response regulator [Deltaproteobacteria bacterium]MCX7952778.1 hybrid sensor histidine kinase/response regulator [Deltaproteobacteria bacterium]